MKTSVQIIRNVLSNWGATAIGTIVGFLMMPFVIHQLGDVKYGIWVIIMNFTGYLGLFDLGVAGSAEKYVAEYKGKHDSASLNEVCSVAFYMFTVLGIIAVILAGIIASYLLPLFKIPVDQLTEAKYVTVIVGLQIGIALPVRFFSGFMRGMQRYDLLAIIRTANLLLRSLTIAAFLLMGYGLICIAIIYLVSTIVGGIVRAAYVYSKNPLLELKIGLIRKDKIKMLGSYSLYLFVFFLSSRIIFSMDTIIVGYFIAAAAVTLYAIPQRLIDYLRLLIIGTGVIRPSVSSFEAKGATGQIQDLLIKGTKYSLMISLPIGISYIVVGKEFVSLWIGGKYALESHAILWILSIGIIAHISKYTSNAILQGLAKHRLPAYVAICEVIMNLVLSIILIRKYGIIGAAIGTMIPMVCLNIVLIQWYTCRVLAIPLIVLFREAYLTAISAALLYFLALYSMLKLIVIETWLAFFLMMAVTISFYIFCAFFICLSKSERTARLEQLRAAFGLV